MPKPLFLARSAGLYVRFLVPHDLRAVVGSRFVVRPLRMPAGDRARLAAAYMGVALSQMFQHLRQGDVVDIKKALDAAQGIGSRDLTLGSVELPNGTVLRNVQVDTPEDERQLKSLMEAAGAGQSATKPKFSKETAFVHLMEVHLSDLRRAERDSKTVLESRHSLSLFMGVVGNNAVSDLGGDDCRLFLDEVRYWPKHATKRPEFARMSVKAVLAKAKTLNEPAPAQATINKHRQRLSVFFNWLLRNKHITHNPLLGVVSVNKADAEEETGRPFTQEELDAVFDEDTFQAWAENHPHRWWVPMLGLYSGARVNELSQLYLADIETVDGVCGYHVNRRFEGQKFKSPASKRFVPLAQPLLNAGFLDFVADIKKAGHTRLFPHLPNNDGKGFGKHMSRQFCSYIKKQGVKEEGMGMHAFRHTLATRLDRAGVSENAIARITGHQSSQSVLPKFYIDQPTLPERVLTLAKFQADVVLPAYKKGQFNVALKEAHDLPAKWGADKSKRERKAKGKEASVRSP